MCNFLFCVLEELSVQLKDTSAKFIIATPECVDKARLASLEVPSVKVVYVKYYI